MGTEAPLIPFNRPSFVGSEMAYVAQALAMGHISGNGQFTQEAQQAIERIAGAKSALMTTSCTHALELSARLLDLGPGDEVIVPAFTFVSTAAAFALTGAKPVFVDVTPGTLNLDVEQVSHAMTSRTRAVCTVNYAGIADRLDDLASLCHKQGIVLIEDNAHGFGAEYKGRKLGTFGAMSTLSFHETKNITCGEGGALTLNDLDYLLRAEILREKGTDRARFLRGQVDKYTWVDLGSSWVASDLLAAYLLAQLEEFEAIQRDRLNIWNAYDEAFRPWAQELNVRLPHVPADVNHPAHMFYLRWPSSDQRARFIDHMKELGIMAVFHYQALNNSEMGSTFGGKVGQCPVAEEAAECLVRLPLFRSMTEHEIARVIDATLSFRG